MGSEIFVAVLLAIFIPPVGVFLRYGISVSSLFIFLLVGKFLVISNIFVLFFNLM